MPLEDILGLCIGIPTLISMIVLLYIMAIKSINTEKKYKESNIKLNKLKIKYYEWLLKDENYNNNDDEEREE